MMRCFGPVVLGLAWSVGLAHAETWPGKHGDIAHTGRAGFVVPAARLNDTFFDVLRWQVRSPGSPSDGGLSSTSMVFFDGAGPGGADIVVGGYHWPKGVQGMDRHTGTRFWYGNPAGGETIGSGTPAFSSDGSVIYVINDATGTPGHPLMAFHATSGPSVFWHNGDDLEPGHLSQPSPTIAPDGRIFVHAWNDRPYAATDYGTHLAETWAAASASATCLAGPSLYMDGADLLVVTGGRWGIVKAYDGATGAEHWWVQTMTIDATMTIDPANGNIYVGAGSDDIWAVGLDKSGFPLWGSAEKLVYDHIEGVNNPQRAQAAGCLSHDGSTYYFQTLSNEGDGRLYAINSGDGSVKWSFQTDSAGWEGIKSSPIVTPNGIVIVGNNGGGAYYAIADEGVVGTLLDTLAVEDGGHGSALATPTLSADGLLYLPARVPWIVSNGAGEIPTFQVENLFNAFDLNADASMVLPQPPGQMAVALNNAVALSWQPILDPTDQFAHYAVYRSTAAFSSVDEMTPIGMVPDIDTGYYLDDTALNGTSYYYAVTTVSVGGGEVDIVTSMGPRTPYDETDLQMLSISRTPRYPRYDPLYTYYEVTEPSGFGPYAFTAATDLGSGQGASTQRWPNIDDPVTYTATVRNRGSNPWIGTLAGTWTFDGSVIGTPSQAVSLEHGDSATFEVIIDWDAELHDVAFEFNVSDARAENNALTINTRSVAFLTYVDVSFIEDFRELSTPDYPQAATDDMLDWLQRHAARMNEMFAEAGSLKRVHYDVLAVLNDYDPDPGVDRLEFAIFPFRYYAASYSDPRAPGYYHADVDIDYGLCHEMSHQLGLIDLYRLDLPASKNYVSGIAYWATDGLMRVVSPFYSENSALAMNHWIASAHGYYGQYLYSMPEYVELRIVDSGGHPVAGAAIKMYQKAERPGLGEVITTQVKAEGVTDTDGIWRFPNVPIDQDLVPITFAGDELRDNPFGYVAVVGSNGLLHFEIECQDVVEYAWLEITEVNNAYWKGQTAVATFDREIPVNVMLLGDLNCDGAVDAFDIGPFVLALLSTPPDHSEYYAEYPDCDVMLADIDASGHVDGFDIDPFVALLTGG